MRPTDRPEEPSDRTDESRPARPPREIGQRSRPQGGHFPMEEDPLENDWGQVWQDRATRVPASREKNAPSGREGSRRNGSHRDEPGQEDPRQEENRRGDSRKKVRRRTFWCLLLAAALLFLTGLIAFRACRPGGAPGDDGTGSDPAAGGAEGDGDADGKADRGPVICIDAGHGFTKSSGLLDVGCNTGAYTETTGKTEADFNLELAFALRDALRARGYTVVMVREKNEDKRLEIAERSGYIDALSPDLCISLHGNSFDGSVTGTRVFVSEVRPDCDAFGAALVDAINREQQSYPALTDPAAVMKKDDTGIAILRDVHCPVVLVESCFLDAEIDAVKAASPLWQAQMAEALADGIDRYLK